MYVGAGRSVIGVPEIVRGVAMSCSVSYGATVDIVAARTLSVSCQNSVAGSCCGGGVTAGSPPQPATPSASATARAQRDARVAIANELYHVTLLGPEQPVNSGLLIRSSPGIGAVTSLPYVLNAAGIRTGRIDAIACRCIAE